MKLYIYTITASLMVVLLTACVTKQNPAHTEVYVPGAGTIDYHCPPGQRKKGKC